MARISKTTYVVGAVVLYGGLYLLFRKPYKKPGFIMQGNCDRFSIAPSAIGLYFQRAQAALKAAFPDLKTTDQIDDHTAEEYGSAIMKAIFPQCSWPPAGADGEPRAITIGELTWEDYISTLQEWIDKVGGLEAVGPEAPSVTELIAQFSGEVMGHTGGE